MAQRSRRYSAQPSSVYAPKRKLTESPRIDRVRLFPVCATVGVSALEAVVRWVSKSSGLPEMLLLL